MDGKMIIEIDESRRPVCSFLGCERNAIKGIVSIPYPPITLDFTVSEPQPIVEGATGVYACEEHLGEYKL